MPSYHYAHRSQMALGNSKQPKASITCLFFVPLEEEDSVPCHNDGINSFISNLACSVIMPRRSRNYVALPRFLLLVAGAAAAVGSGPPDTVTTRRPPSSHESLPLNGAEATNVASSFQHGRNRAWGAVPRSWNPCRRRNIVHNVHRSSDDRCLVARTADPAVTRRSRHHDLSWARVRGGAGTRVDVDGSIIFGNSVDDQEGVDTVGLAEDELSDADENEVDGEGEQSDVSYDRDIGVGGSSEGQDQEKYHHDDKGEKTAGAKAERSGGEHSAGTEERMAEAAMAEGSAALKVGLGEVLPALMKSGAAFMLGTWLNSKLSPSVPGQVRAARIIYTAYLIFSQALCMYLRYLIWKRDDDTEVAVLPPPQLKKMVEGVGGAGAAASGEKATAGATASGATSPLVPMLEKMLTSRTPAKAYDMKVVQGMRRGQFWASLFMCFTHLRRGMIKPMILQVSFGVLALLDSPLFKIYVLGRQAEGDLARPFKKQGFMASLSGPAEGLAAKAEEARVAAEARVARGEATAEPRDGHVGQGGGGESDGDATLEAGVVEDSYDGDDDDEAMPSVVDDVTEDAEETIDQ